MRCTQYIGLNKHAQDFVEHLVKIETNDNFTYGMFNEKIPLSVWYNPTHNVSYLEVAQVVPWNGGPMIFTCLEDQYGERLFRWKENEKARGHEYLHQEGIYWI